MTARPDWPAVMSTDLAAAYLDISPWTIRSWARTGELPQVRLTPNGHPKYRRQDLDALIERRRSA